MTELNDRDPSDQDRAPWDQAYDFSSNQEYGLHSGEQYHEDPAPQAAAVLARGFRPQPVAAGQTHSRNRAAPSSAEAMPAAASGEQDSSVGLFARGRDAADIGDIPTEARLQEAVAASPHRRPPGALLPSALPLTASLVVGPDIPSEKVRVFLEDGVEPVVPRADEEETAVFGHNWVGRHRYTTFEAGAHTAAANPDALCTPRSTVIAVAFTLALAQLGLLMGGICFYRLRRSAWAAALGPLSTPPPPEEGDVIYSTPEEFGGYGRFGSLLPPARTHKADYPAPARALKADYPVPVPRGGM